MSLLPSSGLHLLVFCVCLAPGASMPRLLWRTDQIYLTARSGSRVRFLAVGGIAVWTYQMIQLDRAQVVTMVSQGVGKYLQFHMIVRET